MLSIIVTKLRVIQWNHLYIQIQIRGTWNQKIKLFSLFSVEGSVWRQLHTNKGINRREGGHSWASLECRQSSCWNTRPPNITKILSIKTWFSTTFLVSMLVHFYLCLSFMPLECNEIVWRKPWYLTLYHFEE